MKVGHNVELGHLRQHAEVPADPGLTVLAHAQRSTGLSEAKTRGLLGQFLFSGDDVTKLVTQLSGGEAQRLSLALLVSSDSNVLILDEPTNHLDLESREALEDALSPLQRHPAARLARPGDARGGRHADRGRRGPEAARLQRRLGGVPRARGRTGRDRSALGTRYLTQRKHR